MWKKSPRKDFIYWNDDGQLVAIRVNEWKTVFLAQDGKEIKSGAASSPISACPSFSICVPTRSSAAANTILYEWMADRAFVQVPVPALAR